MFRLNNSAMDAALSKLREGYRVFSPKRVRGSLRYDEIASVAEIVLDEQTSFSPKEIYYPIVQTMLYFSGGECKQSEAGDKPMIILARPCDINAIRRLDKIFLENGGAADLYYARLRNRMSIFLLECRDGFESCFCTSMGGNAPTEYSAALRFENGSVQIEVRDQEFTPYFSSGQPCDFKPEYPVSNAKKLDPPEIRDADIERIHAMPFWNEAAKDCVGCGGCNAVCGTCSCFDTVDIIYDETSLDGERRRVWGSCMREDFAAMAGGHNARKTAGERLRFKALHKLYDYRARFKGENMCVGCGRCDMRCPAKISFFGVIERLGRELGDADNE